MTAAIAPDIAAPRSHSAKRLSIIEAAARVFCREGFSGSNIDLIAAEAGVSRQTVYNHHGDKEKLFVAVVREVTERANAGFFETLSTFPDHPSDLHADLTAFAVRINKNCLCNDDGKFLRKLLQGEAAGHPELFTTWRENGPAMLQAALAARFARLTLAGHLDIDDPDLAARQFLALGHADLQMSMMLGIAPTDEQHLEAATNAVTTFLRAFGRKPPPPGVRPALAAN
jgi:AcrR family transcriptional regulator